MTGLLRRVARRVIGSPAALPDVAGEAPPGWYDRAYLEGESYHKHYRQSHYYFLWCLIAQELRREGWPAVLEIGCGPGQMARLLLDQGLTHYAGFDFSAVAVELARTNLPGRDVWQGDAREPANYARSGYAAALCTEVLEHVERDDLILAGVKPGTLFLGTVPSFPYKSHVRTFPDAESVRSRYGPYLADFSVTTWPHPVGEEGDVFHLFSGRRV